MTTAVRQFLRDLASVIRDGASAVGAATKALFLFALVWGVILIVWTVITEQTAETPQQEAARLNRQARNEEAYRQNPQLKQELCHEAKACKKYSEARLECATAGNFKTCLRIKMGEDSFYSDMCSGYEAGAPAIPLPPETPNALECFFLTLGQ